MSASPADGVAGPRRALVTGGSGGIGGAICRRLAQDGHYVYVHCHRGVEVAEALVRDIVAAGGRAATIEFDITDTEAARGALEAALAAGLARVGLPRPRVSVASVGWLARNVSGKLVRYVRLPASPSWAVRSETPSAARAPVEAAPAAGTPENSTQIHAR
jgi:NAD(P)-dependent dehydrogenase (short-subunit alcohol dehydrogenase family)